MPIPTVFRSEYQINDAVTVDNQTDVSLTALANGRFTLAWQSNTANTGNDDIRFSIRTANGDAFATFNDDPIATNGALDENRPAVAGLSDGRSVYIWEELNAPGSSGGEIDTFALVRNADGSVFKSRFVLSTQAGGSTDDQNNIKVMGLANGNFMVTWKDDGAASFLKALVFDIAGNQIGGTTTVSTDALTLSLTNIPQMILLANGNVVITWQEGLVDTVEQQRYAVLAPDGTIIKVDTDVNPEDAVSEDQVGSVVALANGNFVIIFERNGNTNDIQGRLFDPNGTALGGRFDISTGNANPSPRATALADGRFMVVYDNGSDLFAQMMFADGTKDGAQFTISNAAGVQNDAEITTLADGRIVVAWKDTRGGTSDIFAEIYDPRQTGLLQAGTSAGDDWQGTGFADFVLMGAGNDLFSGNLGSDVAYGDAGDDTLRGGDGNDSLIGGNGNDTLEGDIGDDNLNGNLGNDTLRGGDGNDILLGEDGNDTLEGGNNDDSLNGGTGNDTLKGGAGIDLLQGEAGDDNLQAGIGNDTLFGQAGIDTMFGEAGDDTLFGGDGNDTLFGQDDNDTLFGEVGNDTILGGTGNDFLFGQAGDDTLQGEAGNDFLSGEQGFDQLTGGTNSDTFFWNSFTQGADIVSDFNHAEGDKVMLDHTAFGVAAGLTLVNGSSFVTGSGAVALQATASIIFDTATNLLWFDPDGTGAAGKQALAFLTNGGGGITAGDIIFS